MHLDTIFAKLAGLNFSVNIKKCSFAKSTIKYLGHIIASSTHQSDAQKAEAIQNLVRPHTKRKLKTFLGLFTDYLDYVPLYVGTAYCLMERKRQRNCCGRKNTIKHSTN